MYVIADRNDHGSWYSSPDNSIPISELKESTLFKGPTGKERVILNTKAVRWGWRVGITLNTDPRLIPFWGPRLFDWKYSGFIRFWFVEILFEQLKRQVAGRVVWDPLWEDE